MTTESESSIKLDKINILAVPTTTFLNGHNYMFVRGEEGGKPRTLFLEMDKNFNLQKKREWSSMLPPLTHRLCLLSNGINLHCFFLVSKLLIGTVVAGEGSRALTPIGGSKNPIQTTANWVGIASHDDDVIFVMIDSGAARTLDFYLTTWPKLYTREGIHISGRLPQEYKDLQIFGAEAVCVMAPPSHSKSKDMELHLVFGAAYIKPQTTENGLLFAECNVVTSSGKKDIDISTIIWTKYPQKYPVIGQHTTIPRLHLGIEGRAYAMTYISSGISTVTSTDEWGPLAESSPSVAETKDIQLWRREKPGLWINLGNPLDKAGIEPRDVRLVGGITDVSGDILTTPSLANAGLEDKSMPVNRIFFYLKPNIGNEIFYWKSDFGALRRRGLAKIAGGQAELLGIFQGPPPIPNENVNIPDEMDPTTSRGKGLTTFAQTKEQEKGFQVKASIGVMALASGEVGAGMKLQFEASLAAGYKFFYERKWGTTNTVKYEIGIKLEKPKEKYGVQATGAVVLLKSAWEGYAYEYVAPAGSPPSDTATTIFQVWPIGMEIATEPYAMNPNKEPIPGDLLSYIVTPDQRKALDEKATLLAGEKKHLTTSWALNSRAVESAESYIQEKFAHAFYIDIKAMYGFGWDATWYMVGTKGKIMRGAQVTNDEEWSSQTKYKLGLSTEVETRGNKVAKDTYRNYTYYTYQLEASRKWTDEFLQNLVTDDWPPRESEAYKMNLALKTRIATGSCPWKIVYVLGDHAKN